MKKNIESVIVSSYNNEIESLSGEYWGFHELIKKMNPQPSVSVDPDDAAILMYTGGTTGIPKAAVLTHDNVLANTFIYREWFYKLNFGEEVILGFIPWSHIAGLSHVFHSLIRGFTMLPLVSFDLEEILMLLVEYKVSIYAYRLY